jgi:tRNA pseudouridine32 synthase/23S rRNA pseudouridine746 synthase
MCECRFSVPSTPIPEILYQDVDLLVVNKPAGLLTETADPTEDSLLRRVGALLERTPVAYHRLDKDTSGCILFGRTARFNRQIAGLFSEKKVRKEYWAVVEGLWPKDLNRVETRIAPMGDGRWENRENSGKPAVTTFRWMGSTEDRSLVQALPKTGRTHQIRLHCLRAGCPVVGDSLYGRPGTDGPLALHAKKLTFNHPGDGRRLETEAPFPDYWNEWMS